MKNLEVDDKYSVLGLSFYGSHFSPGFTDLATKREDLGAAGKCSGLVTLLLL